MSKSDKKTVRVVLVRPLFYKRCWHYPKDSLTLPEHVADAYQKAFGCFKEGWSYAPKSIDELKSLSSLLEKKIKRTKDGTVKNKQYKQELLEITEKIQSYE